MYSSGFSSGVQGLPLARGWAYSLVLSFEACFPKFTHFTNCSSSQWCLVPVYICDLLLVLSLGHCPTLLAPFLYIDLQEQIFWMGALTGCISWQEIILSKVLFHGN